MNYPNNLYPNDPRTIPEQEEDISFLNIIQDLIEENISAFVLEDPENLYDEKNQQILRNIEFSRGTKSHLIVVAPDGFILGISKGFPRTLLLDIHNCLV